MKNTLFFIAGMCFIEIVIFLITIMYFFIKRRSLNIFYLKMGLILVAGVSIFPVYLLYPAIYNGLDNLIIEIVMVLMPLILAAIYLNRFIISKIK
jgi:hypothetical protein